MNKKGFVTIYGLVVMQIVLSFTSYLTFVLKSYAKSYKLEKDLHYTEIYTIQKVKTDLYEYEEQNGTFMYEGYKIHLTYDDITCYIQIYENGVCKINSVLEYDDIDCYIVSYKYV